MADRKISELTNITGVNLNDADEFVVVDTSADETKALTFGELKAGLDTGSGFVRITGDTMTGELTGTGFRGKLFVTDGANTSNYGLYEKSNELNFYDATDTGILLHLQYRGGGVDIGQTALVVNHAADVVVNDASRAAGDFRVESDSGTHMLFVDAGNNRVGINTSSPSVGFEISQNEMKQVGGTTTFTMDALNDGSGSHVGVFEVNTNPARGSRIALTDNDNREFGIRRNYSGGNDITTASIYGHTGSAGFPVMDFNSLATIFNQDGNDQDFRVESDGNANMFLIDAADNSVHIGTTTKSGVLTATGGSTALPTAFLYGSSAASEDSFIMALRDTTAQTATAGVAGLKFTSSPSTDWVIGKSWDTTHSRFFIGNQGGTREFSLRSDFFQFYSGGWINEGGNDHDFGVESSNQGYMFWVDGTNDTVVLNGSGTSTTGALYVNSYTSGDEPMVKIDRGGGGHKGSGILISGANYTNGTDSNAAFLAMNGGNYSTSLTKMIHAYDNGGSYFILQGDGKTSFGHGNTAGATIDVVADANAEAIDVRGRSSDNIGEINFRPNGGGTGYSRVDGRPDALRGLGLHAYGSRDIEFGVNGADRHRIVGQKAAAYSNHQRYGSLLNGAQTYGQWTDTRSSPNGGDVSAQIFSDCYGEWIVVAKFHSNTGFGSATIYSQDQIDTGTGQLSESRISSAWGDSYPTEVRYISASDFAFWRDTRVIDFIHGVPSGRPWKLFWSSGNSSGYNNGGNDWSNSTRAGWDCTYCYDGFGRWHNPNYSFHRTLDATTHTGNVSSAFTTNNTAYVFGSADDSKFSCHKTAASSGQDAEYSQMWGEDDNTSVRYEDYPAVGNNANSSNQSSYNLWVLIKIAPNGEVS